MFLYVCIEIVQLANSQNEGSNFCDILVSKSDTSLDLANDQYYSVYSLFITKILSQNLSIVFSKNPLSKNA